MTIKIGILGASKIALKAIISPATLIPNAQVYAIASRNPTKATTYASKFKIPKTFWNYEALLSDRDVDLVYIALPNSLHCYWTVLALKSGKHVLCEKPLASNSLEAELMVNTAIQNDRILVEGLHYRYHPMTKSIKKIVDNGDLGLIKEVNAELCVYIPSKNNNRFEFKLSGGALMDAGCYPLSLVSYLFDNEPIVKNANASLIFPNVDKSMKVELLVNHSKIPCKISCSLKAMPWQWRSYIKISGEKGSLLGINPYSPHVFNLLQRKTNISTRYEFFCKDKTSYYYQLKATIDAIRSKHSFVTTPDPRKTMNLIDRIYQKARLPIRGS